MGAEWRSVAELEAAGVLLVQDGNHGAYRPVKAEIVEHGIPHVRAADIDEIGRIDFDGAQQINEVAYARIRKGRGQPGDVLFTHKGTVGRIARVPPSAAQFLCSPQTTFWRSLRPDMIDPGYLHAFLRSDAFMAQVRRRMHETDMAPYVSLSVQRQLLIALPPLPEQRAIGEVLGALDEKIESNARIGSAGLNVMKLDFDRRFGSSSGDLSQSSQPLETVAEVVMGQSPPGATYSADPADGMPMVQGMGVFGERFVEPTTFTSIPKKVVEAGTLLMTVRAPVDSLNLTTERTCVGRGVAALATEWPAFVECSLREIAPNWQSEAGGTIYPSVNGRQVREAPVAAADRADVDAFEDFATPLRDRALALHREARRLTTIRDALLPRLVSGRIRVPLTNDLDEAVETVLDARPGITTQR